MPAKPQVPSSPAPDPRGQQGDRSQNSPRGRRTEHAADTREALVAAARRLFAAHGFDGTGTEQIVAEARVTRGALYHHFRDKADLFRAAMAEAAGEVALALVDEQLAAEAASPLDDIREGVSAFLDVCVGGGDFQRIVLMDGPRVLGHETWEELVDRYGRSLLEEWLARAVEAGDLAPVPTGALARLLIAMLTEASLAIARAADPATTRADLGEVLDRLLDGLRPLGSRHGIVCRKVRDRHGRRLRDGPRARPATGRAGLRRRGVRRERR
jgi:AcrR family transcriptional regulator